MFIKESRTHLTEVQRKRNMEKITYEKMRIIFQFTKPEWKPIRFGRAGICQ